MNMVDLSVKLAGLELKTPVVTASGTFGYGAEYRGALDYSKIGAVTAKGVRLDPWPGNPMPRHCEVYGGLVNAIGLQGPGVENFVKYILPYSLGEMGGAVKMIVNIWGGSIEEYAEVAARLDGVEGVSAIELNVSCPNVKQGGHTFGQDPDVLSGLVKKVRAATKLAIIPKLAPNVPDIAVYAKAVEDAGADAISLINTIPAMVIDIERRKPVLGNRTGGLSGRGIHPVAVKCVYDAHKAVKLPLIAMGGVYEPEDAIELMLAGASAVAVGTATFTDPSTAARVCDGIAAYCERHGFASVRDIVGLCP